MHSIYYDYQYFKRTYVTYHVDQVYKDCVCVCVW